MPSNAVPVPTLLPTGGDLPLLTYLDAATGERTALTAAELGDWAARTASLLRDGCGLG
ncbi:MAG TPA: AMP-dependent synthetase, partial [Phytomonospora sp.]